MSLLIYEFIAERRHNDKKIDDKDQKERPRSSMVFLCRKKREEGENCKRNRENAQVID